MINSKQTTIKTNDAQTGMLKLWEVHLVPLKTDNFNQIKETTPAENHSPDLLFHKIK